MTQRAVEIESRSVEEQINIIINKICNDLEVAHPQSGSLSIRFLVELEFENVGFLGQGKAAVFRENLSKQGRESNNKLNTHIWR